MSNTLIKKGFTLVEVVIVLAIAALIMVAVFFAVTGAQRAQRNQSRKDVANRAKAAMVTARGNRSGAQGTPGEVQGLIGNLNGNTIADGNAYTTPCAAGGSTSITLQWATDQASACLEGGAAYTTP